MRSTLTLTVITLAFTLTASTASATTECCMTTGGGHMSGKSGDNAPAYDVSTEVTVAGTIESVEMAAAGKESGMCPMCANHEAAGPAETERPMMQHEMKMQPEMAMQHEMGKMNAMMAGNAGAQGVHLTLKTGDGTFDVHVGPASFLEPHGVTFGVGETIEVVGSKVDREGKTVLIAREITKDGHTITLRDATGQPLWSGGAAGGGHEGH